MLKVLILPTKNNVSDAFMEYLMRYRLRWIRFPSSGFGAPKLDTNTAHLARESPTEAGAMEPILKGFDRELKERGCLSKGGQIVDTILVAAPKQRSTEA